MSNINICDLPDNILERIFGYCDFRCLLKLTEVCSRFNVVVSSCTQLMKQFPGVIWNTGKLKRLDRRPMLKSERKYQGLSIFMYNGAKELGPDLRCFLTRHATTLTNLSVYLCSITSSELDSALRPLAHNLSELSLDMEFNVDGEISPIKFKCLRTMSVWDRTSSSIFGFFIHATTIEKLSFIAKKIANPIEAHQFSVCLQSLDGLKYLEILCLRGEQAVIDEHFNDACRFRLEILDICFDYAVQMDENFWNFMGKQLLTMKKLAFKNLLIDRLDVILLSTSLYKLSLFNCEFLDNLHPLTQNTSITALGFIASEEDIEEGSDHEFFTCSLLKNCVNLKCLSVEAMNLTFEMMFALSRIEMQCLHMCNLKCFPVKIPSLRKLDFLCPRNKPEAVKFLRLNSQLKQLSMFESISEERMFAEAIREMNLDKLVIG